MHQTEIVRLAAGKGKIIEVDQGEIAGTIRFIHKSGYVHTVSVDRQTLTAAQRLQRRGSSPTNSNLRRVIHHTAKSLKVEPLLLGQLRHSFTTWGRSFGDLVRPKGRGVSVEEVAAVLGHTNTRTTRLHYDGTEVPPMVKVPIKLLHPGDPVEPTAGLTMMAV
jgi:integrase